MSTDSGADYQFGEDPDRDPDMVHSA